MMHIVMIIKGQVRLAKEWRKVPNKYKQVTKTTTNKTNTMNRKRKQLIEYRFMGPSIHSFYHFWHCFLFFVSTNLNTLHHCL